MTEGPPTPPSYHSSCQLTPFIIQQINLFLLFERWAELLCHKVPLIWSIVRIILSYSNTTRPSANFCCYRKSTYNLKIEKWTKSTAANPKRVSLKTFFRKKQRDDDKHYNRHTYLSVTHPKSDKPFQWNALKATNPFSETP